MKKGKIIGVLAISACMLTGCIDLMPDMTEEQSELVAEYAADMLLKYSPNYHYRIEIRKRLQVLRPRWRHHRKKRLHRRNHSHHRI